MVGPDGFGWSAAVDRWVPAVSSPPALTVRPVPTAAGVDPAHHPLAGEPRPPEDHARDAAEAGGLPRLPAGPQAPQGAGEVPAGDQLQHAADQAAAEQPARLHALRGENGLGESPARGQVEEELGAVGVLSLQGEKYSGRRGSI